ncbi:MAG: DJ-1/PfpI family protein [Acidobacteriota bacterium]
MRQTLRALAVSLASFVVVIPSVVGAEGSEAGKRSATVIVLLYDGVELMDFAGPVEVFTSANEVHPEDPFRVVLAAEQRQPIATHNGLAVVPDCAFADCPEADLLVVPGGTGVMAAMAHPPLMTYLQSSAEQADRVMSVCVGAFLLARASLLEDQQATTHERGLGYLTQLAPTAKVVSDVRFTDNGRVLTSGGMTAGIDLALHLVGELVGDQHETATRRYMNYPVITEDAPGFRGDEGPEEASEAPLQEG